MFTKKWLHDFFYFPKKDRIFAILVVTIIVGSLILPRYFAPPLSSLPLQKDSLLVLAIDTLQKREISKPSFKRGQFGSAHQYERSAVGGYTEGELFPFDPNTISSEDWQRMGLNTKTSKTIINYRMKGGRFYKKEDLQKIWGMPEGFYERVKDYVRLPSTKQQNNRYSESKPPVFREKNAETININTADTTALISLPGIGSKLSGRIIAFREKLGGFYAVEQIAETYGLPDSTFQKIKSRLQVDGMSIRKINVNTATKEELKAHPYVRWNLANAIVEYRNQHGVFKDLEELKNIVVIDDATYNKIVQYLSLN